MMRKQTVQREKEFSWWREFGLLLGKIVGIGIFFLILVTFFLGILRVDD